MTRDGHFSERLERLRPLLERIVDSPLELEELKRKPGRRLTLRVAGPAGRVIVKLYRTGRAPAVAARVGALAAGPSEPIVPKVLVVDPDLRVVVLTELSGPPLRAFVLEGDEEACRRAGAALGAWHRFWRESPAPAALAWHSSHRELELLKARARGAPRSIARTATSLAVPLARPWPCSTVVHRDLDEEQVLLGERAALIDLDDTALGPPELDVGNLMAHLELLGARAGWPLALEIDALLSGYRAAGGELDAALLDRCRRLSLLRLACVHREWSLIEAVAA
jgi:Ser/Thr protein kinase RdoA (MazF antagonist)